jgi:hypothetical protein
LKGGFRHDPNNNQNLDGSSANKDNNQNKDDEDSEGEEDMDAAYW